MTTANRTINDYLEALQIFQRYAKDPNQGWVLHAEHDILYLIADINDVMAEADATRLNELGWNFEPYEGWSIFT